MNERTTLMILLVRLISYAGRAVLVAGLSLSAAHGNPNDFDHLIPVGDILDPAYERLLSERLFMGSEAVLRITAITPSARGEVGIAIQDRTKGLGDMLVTWAQAEKNLWSAAVDTHRKIVRSPGINVIRLEAPLPRSAGTAVVDGMKRALQRTAPPPETENVTVDGTFFEIALSVKKQGATQRGLLNDNARGKHVAAMRRLIQLLEAYCRAKPAQRNELLSQIDLVAKDI